MSLAERLAEAKTAPRPGFEAWVAKLPKSDRDALMVAAADPSWSHRAVHDAVKAEGARVGRETLANWRKANGYVTS